MHEKHPLPAEAQQHLEQITHDPTRERVAEHIQGLHLVANLQEQQQVPQAEFTPDFVPENDVVSMRMSSIAEQGAVAHAELADAGQAQDGEISPTQIWDRVLENQLSSATRAKEEGDTESAVNTLVDYLITTELTQTSPDLSGTMDTQEKKVEGVLNATVAEGLSTELVEAARRSYGLVRVEPARKNVWSMGSSITEGEVEVTSIAHTIEKVKPQVEVVTGRVVSVDPEDSPQGEQLVPEAIEERIEGLSLESSVATTQGVAKTEEQEGVQRPEVVDQLTIQALEKLPEDTFSRIDRAGELIKLKGANPALSDPLKYEEQFRAIRNLRGVHSHYRINSDETMPLDRTLVDLWERGDKNLAGRILTAGNEISEENGYPGGAIGPMVADKPEIMHEIQEEVERRREACREQLHSGLVQGGISEDKIPDAKHDAELIIGKALSTQDPERTTEIIMGWSESSDAAEILSTINMMDSNPNSSASQNLLIILTDKGEPVRDLSELRQTISIAEELSRSHGFPVTALRDSSLLEGTNFGSELRFNMSKIATDFPLDKLDANVEGKENFFRRVLHDNDPRFIDCIKDFIQSPVIQSMDTSFPGEEQTLSSIVGRIVAAEDPTVFVEENKDYLNSLQNMLNSSTVRELKEQQQANYDALNDIVLFAAATSDDPSRSIRNIEHISDNELFSVLRDLSDQRIAPQIANSLVREAAESTDIEKLSQEWQDLAPEFKDVLAHPLMDIIRPGGILHNRAETILDEVLAHDNKLALCGSIYESFTKPQPLWKSLASYTELLVGEKVEDLGGAEQYAVKTIPAVRLNKGISPEQAELGQVEGFEPRVFSEMTVEQKRSIVSDQLRDMTDEQVTALQEITYDRFTDRVKRALFVFQLQQTVEQSRDASQKQQAGLRNEHFASQGVDVVRQGDFIHGTDLGALTSILQDGNVAGEARKYDSLQDSYPYNVDFSVINGADSVEEKIRATISYQGFSRGESGIMLVYRRNPDSWMADQETYASDRHSLIFGGIPSTEISGLVLKNKVSLSTASRAVVENGFYIPIYDEEGNNLFSPEEYDLMKDDLNMQVRIPSDNVIDSSLKAEDKKGVSEGGVYLFPTEEGPVKYYVKFAENPDHIWTEYAADELYRAAGVAVPDSRVVMVEGRLGRASRWVEEGADLPASESSTLEDGAAMDMLLANWDVVYNSANTMEVDGKILRPDSGSALDMWATGVYKKEGTWGEEVHELEQGTDKQKLWEGMRQEYSELTDDKLKQQVQTIKERLTDEVIDAVVGSIRRPREARDSLKEILKARRNYMIQKILGTPLPIEQAEPVRYF